MRARLTGVRALIGLCLAGALAVMVPCQGARAQTPTAVGWWTTENPGLGTEPVPLVSPPPQGGPNGLPSDVPPGGFEVANTQGVFSYAAIAYEGPGRTVSHVVVKLAPGAVNLVGSKVEACALTGDGSFAPAHGAPAAQGPAYSCSSAVAGTEDAAAGTVTFDAGRFSRDGYVAFAIVGLAGTRMVFSPPDGSTVQLAPLVAPLPETQPPLSAPVPSDAVASPVLAPPIEGAPAAGAEIPAVVETPSIPTVPETLPAPAPPVATIAVTSPSNTLRSGRAPIVAAILIAILAAFVVSRRVPSPVAPPGAGG